MLKEEVSLLSYTEGTGWVQAEIYTDDCKEIVKCIDSTLHILALFHGTEDYEQERIDNLQRIKDGFTELIEYGGR